MKHFLVTLFLSIALVSCSGEEQPQEANPVHRKSPIAITSITHKPSNTYLKIVYGQPYKRGREIFGNLEPYGEVWRTGANEATELTTTQPININGNKLEAGTYALFTIPRKKRWTIILNDSLGQWGAFDYDKKHDHLRTDVTAEHTSQSTEAFSIKLSEMVGDSSSIVMQWDTTRVDVPITFITAGTAR